MGTNTIKLSQHAEAGREVLDAIRRIVQSLRIGSRNAEKKVGLSGAQLFVLQRLGQGPALSLNELARRTLTHQSSASVVVSRLVARGLVERLHSPADARRLELSLTSAGGKLLGKAPDAAQDRLLHAIEKMNRNDVKRLAKLLAEFVQMAGLHEQPPAMLFEEDPAKHSRKKTRKG